MQPADSDESIPTSPAGDTEHSLVELKSSLAEKRNSSMKRSGDGERAAHERRKILESPHRGVAGEAPKRAGRRLAGGGGELEVEKARWSLVLEESDGLEMATHAKRDGGRLLCVGQTAWTRPELGGRSGAHGRGRGLYVEPRSCGGKVGFCWKERCSKVPVERVRRKGEREWREKRGGVLFFLGEVRQ